MAIKSERINGVTGQTALMEAAAIDRFGPPEVLTLHTLPVPEVGPTEVLIEVYSAGVGVWDTEIRAGWWPEGGTPRFPLVLGTDGAGIVAACGEEVHHYAVGDRVWAAELINPKGGFYAEYVAVDIDRIGRVPAHLDLLHAGGGAVTGLTALQGIDEHLQAGVDQTVLIFGATGAVGTLAVQFAKYRQARVLGTATGAEASELVRHLGADDVFDPRSHDFVEMLQESVAPHGIDAALALAGGEALEKCIDLVRPGGRVAFPNGVEPTPRIRSGIQFIPYNGISNAQHFERLEQVIQDSRFEVPIAGVYALEQAMEAHEQIARGHVLGRVVLQVRH